MKASIACGPCTFPLKGESVDPGVESICSCFVLPCRLLSCRAAFCICYFAYWLQEQFPIGPPTLTYFKCGGWNTLLAVKGIWQLHPLEPFHGPTDKHDSLCSQCCAVCHYTLFQTAPTNNKFFCTTKSIHPPRKFKKRQQQQGARCGTPLAKPRLNLQKC